VAKFKDISRNKRAYYQYHILETFEAGVVLLGTEVKAIRDGRLNLADGWVDIDAEGQVFLKEVHIGHYSHGNQFNHEEKRPRRLLLHKKEIKLLKKKSETQGMTIVPVRCYFKNSFVKVEVALAKGKKLHDKRQATREKEDKKDMERAFKNKNR